MLCSQKEMPKRVQSHARCHTTTKLWPYHYETLTVSPGGLVFEWRGRTYGRNSMAKGLYLMPDGQVLVEYGRRRRVPIPPAQYKANGYRPPCDKLPAEAPRKVRKELAHAEA
jgi:hypothetical protein